LDRGKRKKRKRRKRRRRRRSKGHVKNIFSFVIS
jgi:hypothetical protein